MWKITHPATIWSCRCQILQLSLHLYSLNHICIIMEHETSEPNITLLFPCKWSCQQRKMAGTETRRAAKLAFLSVDPATNPNKLVGRPSTYLRKVPLPKWLQVLQKKLYFNNDIIEQFKMHSACMIGTNSDSTVILTRPHGVNTACR